MILTTVRDVVQFISEWNRVTISFPGGPNPLPHSAPAPVRTLDELLGAFWGKSPFPFAPDESNHNTNCGLFDVQDSIVDPRGKHSDVGITPLIYENQGVWSFGYSKDQKLMFRGDWVWSGELRTSHEWSPFPASIEDALVFALLLNFYFYSSSEGNSIDLDFNAPTWQDQHELLWSHPSWSDFGGFYTDHDKSLLIFDGLGAISKNIK